MRKQAIAMPWELIKATDIDWTNFSPWHRQNRNSTEATKDIHSLASESQGDKTLPSAAQFNTRVPGLQKDLYSTPTAIEIFDRKIKEYSKLWPEDCDKIEGKRVQSIRALGEYLPRFSGEDNCLTYNPEDLVPCRILEDRIFEDDERELRDYWLQL